MARRGSDISVAAWIEPSSSSEAAVAFEYNGYGLGVSNGNSGGNLAALNIPCTENINSPAAISDGVAHFVVGTIHENADGSTTAILYVDGVLVNQATAPICDVSNITPNTAIGADASAGHGAFAFAGFLSGAVVFSQALTLNQVQSLYQGNPNLGSPTPSPSPSPTPASAYATAILSLSPYAFYELNETSGTVAADSSGNGRTGTYNGTSGTTYLQGQPGIIPGESWTSLKTLAAVANSAPVTMGQQLGVGFSGKTWASDLTVVGWLKPSSLPQTSVAAEINGYGLAVIGSSAAINVPCGTNVTASAATFSDGKAHFIAAAVHEVGTATTLTLYADGVQVAQQSNVAICNESTLNPNTAIGANSGLTSNGVFHYSGYVSGIAVFSSALSNAQILALFQSN